MTPEPTTQRAAVEAACKLLRDKDIPHEEDRFRSRDGIEVDAYIVLDFDRPQGFEAYAIWAEGGGEIPEDVWSDSPSSRTLASLRCAKMEATARTVEVYRPATPASPPEHTEVEAEATSFCFGAYDDPELRGELEQWAEDRAIWLVGVHGLD